MEQLTGSLAAVSEQAAALRQGVAELQAWKAESVATAEATAAAAVEVAAAAARAGAAPDPDAAVDPEERGSFTLRMRRGSAPTWPSECETPGGTPRTGGGGPSGGGSFADPGASFVQRIEFQVIPGFWWRLGFG